MHFILIIVLKRNLKKNTQIYRNFLRDRKLLSNLQHICLK